MTLQELFSDPKKWTQGTFARNEHGDPTSSYDSRAICWCLSGAIAVCSPTVTQHLETTNKIRAILEKRGFVPKRNGIILEWNDAKERTFEEIQALVKEANV